jgi:NAD(P)-dependent dehydrogenase (short-subunit alcohol dehydrogenase family)
MTGKKVALVTGASSGIGRTIATLLSDRGFVVFGTTRRLAASAGSSGENRMVQLDVRDDASAHACVGTVLEAAGRIDALVNNAGYALMGALEETSIEEAKALFETNFFGILRMNQAVLPIMRKQGAGRIVNIGSAAGFLPAPYSGIYAASKHALEGYSLTLDHEVRQFGIRVSVIEPGFMRTDMGQHNELTSHGIEDYSKERELALGAVLNAFASGEDPEIVALAVLEALTSRSPRTRYLAGRGAKTVSVLKQLLPAGLFDKGVRKQSGLD